MANKKITELTEALSAGQNDVLAIVDLINVETKKIKLSNLKSSLSLQRSDVGLSNVDNTADINKPISTNVQDALDLKADTSTTYTKLECDTNFESKNTNIQQHIIDTSNPHSTTKTQIGLSNVPNIDATSRSNHTGTQEASTISDFKDAINSLLVEGSNISITYNGTSITISSQQSYTQVREFLIKGTPIVGIGSSLPILVPSTVVIQSIKAYSRIAPSGSDLIFDILKNGSSIFSNPIDRLQIIDSSNTSIIGTFSANLSSNDILELEVIQVGSIISGEDIVVVIEVQHG